MDCDWSDVELATIPCAYGSRNLIYRNLGIKLPIKTTFVSLGSPFKNVERLGHGLYHPLDMVSFTHALDYWKATDLSF